MKWLSKKLALEECDRSSSEESTDGDNESGDVWITPGKGAENRKSSGKSRNGDEKTKKTSQEATKKKVGKHGKKEKKEKNSKAKKSKKKWVDSSSSEEDSSSEEEEPRSKKKCRKELDDEFEKGMNPSEKLLRSQWKKQNEKMSS